MNHVMSALTIDTSGRVGISHTVPSEMLYIRVRKSKDIDELGICEECLVASICIDQCENFLEAHGELEWERGFSYEEEDPFVK